MPRFPILLAFVALIAPGARAQVLELERHFGDYGSLNQWHDLALPDPMFVQDVAHSLADDPCTHEGLPTDGEVNADDIICSIWGNGEPRSRWGLISLIRIDPETCRWQLRTAFLEVQPGRRQFRFVGTPFPYEPEVGMAIQVRDVGLPGEVQASYTVRARCGLGIPSRVPDIACDVAWLALPLDAVYETGHEALCGVEGLDWSADPDTNRPDRCEAGLFDEPSGAPVSLLTPSFALNRVPGYAGLTVFRHEDRLLWIGTDFLLEPGGVLSLTWNPVLPSDPWPGRAWDPPVRSCFAGAPPPPAGSEANPVVRRPLPSDSAPLPASR